jgi:putative ABC transport system permease protein
VGLSDTLPLGRNRSWDVGAKGVNYPREQFPIAFPRLVDHHYLQTMQIPLRAGRYLNEHDTVESERVAVINETMARRLWPGGDAVGQVIVNIYPGDYTVVGVVGDVRHGTLEEAASAEVYLNYRQNSDWSAMDLVLRTSRPMQSLAPDVRAAIRSFDPMLPATESTTLEQIVDHAVAPRRLITYLLAAFSMMALTLSAMGLYGVIAYSVGQRTREIGIRLAVGAQRRDVMGLIVGEGLKTTAIGVVLGVVAALLVTHVLKSLLFGVTATDSFVLVSNIIILFAVALLACVIPARRAARVDPTAALRCE